jgi:uncharacterized protein
MSRIFEHARVWQLGPDAFDRAIVLLADALGPHDPQLAIGIERGGREPATAIAARLNVPFRTLRASHNSSDAIALRPTGRVTLDLQPIIETPPADRVLIVDDICGSGATLRAAIRAVTALWTPSSIHAAVLCRNVGASYSPDAWIWDVADWVTFPWETTPPDTVTQPLPTPNAVRFP